jgi:four helix bundle protein
MLEKMRMYGAAEALAREVEELLPQARAAAPMQADHLTRSVDSVLFNTAEGIGSYKPRVKTSAYDIARKEANEIRAVLRRLVQKRVFTSAHIGKADNLAGACIGMLTHAILATERRAAQQEE